MPSPANLLPGGVLRPDLLAGQALPPEPQQARSRRTRAALKEAALALFAAQGYDATDSTAIASRAGVAVGTFYQHFSSKRQLLLVLMDQLLDEAAALTAAAPPVSAATRDAVIGAMVRQALHTDWAFAGAYRAWREASLRDPELAALHAQIERWTAAQLEYLLGLLLAAGLQTRSGVDLPTFAWTLSLLFWRLAETPLSEPADVERVVANLTQLISHTLFVDEAKDTAQ